MSRKVALAGLVVLVVAVGALVGWWRWGPGVPEPDPDAAPLHPSLAALLQEPAKEDSGHQSRFFTALSALAQPQGFDLDRSVDEGYAVVVRSGGRRYVVAVLRGWSHTIPGDDTQHLLLFNPGGTPLDTLSCSINCRLTRMYAGSGTYRTEVLDPDADVRLVLRYVPEPGGRIAGNWDHSVTHQGRTQAFHWEKGYGRAENKGFLRTADLEREGLCRVAVRDGRFAVLFPPGE